MQRFGRNTLGAIVVAVSMSMAARPARASAFGEENAALYQLVGLEAQQITQIASVLANIRLVVSGVNDVAGGVRRGLQFYQMLRNYSFEDYLRDAKAGLYQGFPELAQIESEVGQLADNVDAVRNGKFFQHRDRHDAKMERVLNAVFRQAYRGTIWPVVFRGAFNESTVQRSAVDDLILNRYRRAGLETRMALQDVAMGALVQKAAGLMKEAEDKKRADLQAAALAAQLAAQTVNNTTRMRDLAEQEAAIREQNELQTEAFEAKSRKTLSKYAEQLVRVTGGGTP